MPSDLFNGIFTEMLSPRANSPSDKSLGIEETLSLAGGFIGKVISGLLERLEQQDARLKRVEEERAALYELLREVHPTLVALCTNEALVNKVAVVLKLL